jgi:hypothetical protein
MSRSESMINHLLMQFSQSVNMHIFLDALGAELDELTQALDDLQNKRWIDTGSGVQLDNIGVLIDRSRNIAGSIQLEFFAFYDQPNALSFGVGMFRDTPSVPYTATSTLDDETYRPVLWHKVSKNTTTGTTESTIESVKFIYNAPFVTLTELGNAKIGIGIGGRELTDNDIVLARALDLFIRAGGVRLDFVEEIPDPFFGFVDQANAKGFEVGILPTEIEL